MYYRDLKNILTAYGNLHALLDPIIQSFNIQAFIEYLFFL